MIVNVNVILLVEKKKNKKKRKLTITTSKEITIVSLTQEGNPSEVDEASSILSEIGGKNVKISSEEMARPLVTIMEEIETQLIEKEGMQNAPTNVDMEKERVQEVVGVEVIIGRKDDRSQYLEDEDVEIIVIKEPYHKQLERELLMQPEEDEHAKKVNIKEKNYMHEH
jgi:hypothetical protein